MSAIELDEILRVLTDGGLVALVGTRCTPNSIAELCKLGLASEADGCWRLTSLGIAARRRAEAHHV